MGTAYLIHGDTANVSGGGEQLCIVLEVEIEMH